MCSWYYLIKGAFASITPHVVYVTYLSNLSLSSCVLMQVVAESTQDKWLLHRPTELKPGQFAEQLYKGVKGSGTVKEKNWMPFVWQDELFMVHSVMPHRVFR